MRASLVVNCHSALAAAALRRCCQAWTWRSSVARSPTRSGRSRPRALSSISAMFSQEPCLGAWWILIRSARRLASSGAKVGIELVHDQDDLVRRAVAPVHQLAHKVRPVGTPELVGD